jgi:N-carbamoyl-L-amino-acid hydrolase
MDAGFQDAFEASATRLAPGRFQRMPSGAGHDAQILAGIMPSGMLFVPSISGISHHYAEDTSDDDLVVGCQVFVDAAAALLEG